MASTDATPIPVKNQAYRVTFPILDADGDLVTGAASLDSEVSKDAGTFADCTNEATEIATSSGVYYLDLTATEMNADTVAIIVKSGTAGAKTTTLVLYPRADGADFEVDVTHWNGTAVATPDTAGHPKVTVKDGTGTGEIALTSGAIDTVTSVTNGVTLAAGAITNASLAGNMEIVFETDFATNYNATRNAWATNVQDFVGTSAADPFNGQVVAASVTGAVGSVTGAVGSVTGNVGGNVTGSVGSISGITFPTNFADFSITASTGLVDVNTKTGFSLAADQSAVTIGTVTTNTDMRGTDSAALASVCTEARLAELGAANLPADIDAILTDTGTTLEGHLTDIKGGTFSGATDSLEAIRDRGDAAWTTGAGGTPPQLLQSTTIATLASQTSFTLTAGSADDDAYNGAIAVVTDSATSTQKAVGTVSDYTGSSKTVTLSADPGIFTMAVGDTIEIIAALGSAGSAPTAVQIRQEMDSNSTQLAAIVADTNELQTDDVPTTLATLATAAELAKVPKSDGTTSWNATALAAINAEADTALSDYDPPTRAELTSDKAEIITDLDDIKGTGFVKDTHSLVDIEAYVDILDDGTSGNAKIATDVAAVLVDTADIQPNYATSAELAKVPKSDGTSSWNATALAAINAEADTALSDYDPPTKAELDALLTTAMTESYNADGSPPTPAQALMGIYQMLTEKSVTGTTVTIKKLDGSTTAMTLTLNDGTTPTSITRAT